MGCNKKVYLLKSQSLSVCEAEIKALSVGEADIRGLAVETRENSTKLPPEESLPTEAWRRQSGGRPAIIVR